MSWRARCEVVARMDICLGLLFVVGAVPSRSPTDTLYSCVMPATAADLPSDLDELILSLLARSPYSGHSSQATTSHLSFMAVVCRKWARSCQEMTTPQIRTNRAEGGGRHVKSFCRLSESYCLTISNGASSPFCFIAQRRFYVHVFVLLVRRCAVLLTRHLPSTT